jgi:hypothetical protein
MPTKKTTTRQKSLPVSGEVILNLRIIRTPSGGHRIWIERTPRKNREDVPRVIDVPQSENPLDFPGGSDPIN